MTPQAIADTMATNGMRDVGYQYINIDDCWQVGPPLLQHGVGGWVGMCIGLAWLHMMLVLQACPTLACRPDLPLVQHTDL